METNGKFIGLYIYGIIAYVILFFILACFSTYIARLIQDKRVFVAY